MKNKVPRWKKDPSPQKKPRVDSDLAPKEISTISWHIKLLDKSGLWHWNNIQNDTLWKAILEKLANFETMTWEEIIRGGSHPIKVSDLCSNAQKRLREIKQDDIEELFSLRLEGKPRIWGIRNQGILKILWWDPNHEVCPSEKKHT